MKIKLEPINDTNRKAVLALTVREDQPFVAQNDYPLSEADEANARAPGTARPFATMRVKRLSASVCSPWTPRMRIPSTGIVSGV